MFDWVLLIFMTGYIYTFSSFLLHIHRGFALLLPSRASWVFRSFNALPRPTNSHGGSPIICLCPGAFRPTNLHGGSPINMPLSCRTEHRPTLQRALLPRCRSCSLLLGVALNPPLPDRGRLRAGRLLPYDVFLLGVVVSGAPMRSSAMLRS